MKILLPVDGSAAALAAVRHALALVQEGLRADFVLGPGAFIGELALIDDEPRSATIAALKPCRLIHLSKQAFFRLADENPLIYRQALRLLAHRLRGTNESVVAQGTVSVSGRVARAFASLAEGLGDEQPDGRILLAHKITQNDIAGMAGVARENASRAINGAAASDKRCRTAAASEPAAAFRARPTKRPLPAGTRRCWPTM